MPKITKFRRGLNTRIIKIPGPPNFFHSGSFPSPSSLSTASEVKESQLEHPSVLRCNNSSGLPSEGGTGLVGRPPSSMEWKSAIPEFCRHSDRNRCVPQGLGGVLRRSKYRGPMVYRRTEVSHKLSRPPCRVLCHQNLLQKQSSRTCQTADGQMDNLSAVACINKMRGTHSKTLAKLAIDLWNWCLDHKIHNNVSSTPTRNSEFESRQGISFGDRPQDWKLNPAFFKILVQKWGPLEVDLFASRLTFKLPHFVSWKPDPQAIATNAFLMNWRDFRGYAFPPFALVGRGLQQVMAQNVDHLVLVAPVWPAQPWYPVLIHLAVDKRLLFPVGPELLMKDNHAHPLTNLQLAGWVLSASIIKHQVFREKLETFCWRMAKKHLLCILLCLEQMG